MVAIRSSLSPALPAGKSGTRQPAFRRTAHGSRSRVRHAPAYLVAYDVSDHRERVHVAKILEGFGVRSQKSVFTCHLTRAWLAAMNGRLRDLCLKTGSVLIAPVDQRRMAMIVGTTASPSLPSRTAAIIV